MLTSIVPTTNNSPDSIEGQGEKEKTIEQLNSIKQEFYRLKEYAEAIIELSQPGEWVNLDLTKDFSPEFLTFLTNYFGERVDLRSLGVRSHLILVQNHDFHSPTIFNQLFTTTQDYKDIYEEIYGEYHIDRDSNNNLAVISSKKGSKFWENFTMRLDNTIAYIENTLVPYVENSEQLMEKSAIENQLKHTGVDIHFLAEPTISTSDYATYVNTLIVNAVGKPELATKNVWFGQFDYDNIGYTLYYILDDGWGTDEKPAYDGWQKYKAALKERFKEGFIKAVELPSNSRSGGLSLAYSVGKYVHDNLESIRLTGYFEIQNIEDEDALIDKLFSKFVMLTDYAQTDDPNDPDRKIPTKGVGFLVKTS